MLKKIRSAYRLPTRDLLTVLEAWCMLLYVHALLAVLPYTWWRRLLWRTANPARKTCPDRQLIRLFTIAAKNHLWHMNCLRRSLALRLMLAHRDIDAALMLGIRRSGDDLEGHAWLQVNGSVINDHPDVADRFTPLANGSKAGLALQAMGR